MAIEKYGQYGKNRLWEIIPGALDWSILIGTLALALASPAAAIILVIIFDIYWFLRVLYFVIHLLSAYHHYRLGLKTNFTAILKEQAHRDQIYHLIMLPTFKEEILIIRESLQAIIASKYHHSKLLVVIGGEELDKESFREIQTALSQEFDSQFLKLIFTIHPANLPGEIPGKGSNLKFMGESMVPIINSLQIDESKIIVSAFDVDTLIHPEYLAALTYNFLTVEKPLRSSYQPVTIFANNLWSAPAPVRIAAFGTTFWLFSEMVRPERMWSFSSHSMPWQMLLDVGFWEPDLVSEDSRIFMQAFLHYDGDYKVTPIFLPAAMDTVVGKNWWDSLKALYLQQRRWAWGVEHIPYMITEFKKHPKISWWHKSKYLFNHFEGMLSWACVPFIIFVLGYLPFLLVHGRTGNLFVNSPYTLEWLMRGSMIGILVTGVLSFAFIPPRPKSVKGWAWVTMFFQWLLLPITSVLFGALPALHAHTRLMFGKYLGFNVTPKKASSRE